MLYVSFSTWPNTVYIYTYLCNLLKLHSTSLEFLVIHSHSDWRKALKKWFPNWCHWGPVATPEFSYVCGLANFDAWNPGNRIDGYSRPGWLEHCKQIHAKLWSTIMVWRFNKLESYIRFVGFWNNNHEYAHHDPVNLPIYGNCQHCQTAADFPKKPIHRVKQSVPKFKIFLSFRRNKRSGNDVIKGFLNDAPLPRNLFSSRSWFSSQTPGWW